MENVRDDIAPLGYSVWNALYNIRSWDISGISVVFNDINDNMYEEMTDNQDEGDK